MVTRRSILSILTFGFLLNAGCFQIGNNAKALEYPERRVEVCETDVDTDVLEDQVLQLVNLERAAHGLAPVVLNAKLNGIAADYACLMIAESFFSHKDPITGRGPGERAIAGKYRFYAVGENLAAGQETAAEVMKLWMESPSHREIILDPKWKEIGLAVRRGGEYGTYWVQEFGDPATMATQAP